MIIEALTSWNRHIPKENMARVLANYMELILLEQGWAGLIWYVNPRNKFVGESIYDIVT